MRFAGAITLTAGAALFMIGIYLEFFAVTLKSEEILLKEVLELDLGPGLTAVGIALLHLSRHRMFYHPTAFGVVIVSGMWTASIALTFVTVLGALPHPSELDVAAVLLRDSLTFSVGPALIAVGVLSYFLAQRVWRSMGYNPDRRRMDVMVDLSLIGALAMPYLTPIILSGAYTGLLKLLGFAVGTWLVWHLTTPRVASLILLGLGEKGFRKKLKRFNYRFHGVSDGWLAAGKLIDRAYYPMAMALGVVFTYLSIVELIQPLEAGLDPIQRAVDAAVWAFVPLLVGSVFFGPVFWVLEASGVKVYDKARLTLWVPRLPSPVESFVEAYSLLQGLVGFSLTWAHRDPVFAVILIAMTASTVFLVSLIATTLYSAFSMEHNVRTLLETCWRKGVALPSKPPTPG